ncbi:hypothetical protein GCM10007989_38050 [Devosia pacifica]|uniref:Uncharacterized protein n=1 Tax=Devosia pacifica TaxID=1335967 RepID=A0A918VZH8_9HYPH|nr:hypothetical protein [Devosia pacifica]GHA38694.1 hypothetical protein GCM10007989_38050 [Devosia pacifica]
MDDRNSSQQMIGTLVFILTGPILWAADLTAIYGGQSSLCAFEALPQGVVGWLVIATSVVLILADIVAIVSPLPLFNLLVGRPPPPDQRDFILGAMRGLGTLSALAMLYFTLAAVLLPACEQLR